MWNILIEHIYFESKSSSVRNSERLCSNDLDDLIHKILLYIGNNLIEWNRKYISTFDNNINPKSFQNDVERNLFMCSLHRSLIKEDEFWYNKHRLICNESSLSILNQLVTHISAIENHLLVELPIIPSVELPYPKFNFLDKLLGEDKVKLNRYEESLNKLKTECEIKEKYKRERTELNNTFKNELNAFKETLNRKIKKLSFELGGAFEKRISEYELGNNLRDFVDYTLNYSILNALFKFNHNCEILEDNHLICDISLLNDTEVSKIKSYKEFKRDSRVEPIYYNDKDFKKLYDSVIYSVFFRVIIELFTSDYNSHIKRLSLNGWVDALNKKNGKYENKCIMSLSISREQFDDIDFANVDLKEAFRHLKGISAASLIDFIPIAPIMIINKADKRFIQSEEVLKNINDSTNIAAIDWEEFEHLVRELFEKEFAVNGGEVKVTQSSRDGGVDAIAFDPDPIRGGKIIIQSKRYTNVVGVSAIRDLYGTVVNEGATKGIIVTTSHYGNDAYEFAKGKPLTLLDGGHLLYLLEKHGYKAKIDIEEAKKMQKG
jgi:restriction system protein